MRKFILITIVLLIMVFSIDIAVAEVGLYNNPQPNFQSLSNSKREEILNAKAPTDNELKNDTQTSSGDNLPAENQEEISKNSNEKFLTPVKLDIRGFDEIVLPTGTFIPVISTQEISTETCPEGFKLKFISTNDVFMYETNIIPRNTEFFGYIEKINEPVVGTNASMKIKITKLLIPDGFEIPIKAYVYSLNNNLIGGELTQPAEWVKMPHYQSKFQGVSWNHRAPTLQIRPGGRRSMGTHTKIQTGEHLTIILVAPAGITHTIVD